MSRASEASSMPVAVKVHVSTGQGMEITWADGHHSHYEFAYLRDRCPCAVCTGEHGIAPASAPPSPLPLYKPRATARAASAVGHYAVQFDFSDGHSTGIFSFDYLRGICPCESCRSASSAP